MPSFVCCNCNCLQKFKFRDLRYLDKEMFLCSSDCLFEQITRRGFVNAALPGCICKVNLGRASERYSPLLDKFFRSSYEQYFAETAYHRGLEFLYEELGFVLPSGAQYVPDFYFPWYSVFVEVKGAWRIGAKKKVKEFREAFPTLPLLVAHWRMKGDFY